MKEGLKAKLESLPAKPGVYVFRDGNDQVIYVGKAKSLSDRVRSYFRSAAPGDLKGRALRGEIDDLEVTVCRTEVDALILESTLIKRYKPRYNVMLRDDKSYPYVSVTVSDEYPTVSLTRGRRMRGVKYYGPYVNARAARNTIRMLSKVFPLRHCTGRAPGRKEGSPCLYYEMKMCLGPCRGDVDPEEYARHVRQYCDFLEGRHADVLEELDARMRAASRDQEYEEAARLRNQIDTAKKVIRHNRALSSSTEDYDVIGSFADETRGCFAVAQNRGGFHLGNLVFFTDLHDEIDSDELVSEFLKRYYDQAGSIPGRIIVPAVVEEEVDPLKEWLSSQRGSGVDIRIPRRGGKLHEMSLACANARLALEGSKLQRSRDRETTEAAMAELAAALELEKYPLRIECYDISTFGGAASVGSLVVFQDGLPARRDYRRFTIKFTPGVDDVGMMREVLYRRFKRLAAEAEYKRSDERASSWGKVPDLVLLDGGVGQLGAARDVLKVLGFERVEIAALAKRLEEVFRPGASEPRVLARNSEALFLLQRIRDEAHRVAVTYNRYLMERSTSSSWLDGITGVGPSRKKALIRHLGSPQKVMRASLDELSAVPGVPESVAEAVYKAARLIEGGPHE
jgi:excinuclease ABC subunit C